jgi:hypothetical protein
MRLLLGSRLGGPLLGWMGHGAWEEGRKYEVREIFAPGSAGGEGGNDAC